MSPVDNSFLPRRRDVPEYCYDNRQSHTGDGDGRRMLMPVLGMETTG